MVFRTVAVALAEPSVAGNHSCRNTTCLLALERQISLPPGQEPGLSS